MSLVPPAATVFCVQCGTLIEGRFCWRCGAEAHVQDDAAFAASAAARGFGERSYAHSLAAQAVPIADRLRAALAAVPLPDQATLVAVAAAILVGVCCLAFPVLALVVAIASFAALAYRALRESRAESERDPELDKEPTAG